MIKEAIAKLVQGESLTQVEAQGVMYGIMRGEATNAQIASFLTALRIKGETAEEIAGCAQAMRAHSLKVMTKQQDELVDTCGTGGDGTATFNISTTVALVLAGTGLRVAKHGNRSVSSRCGSADLLGALGVMIDLGPEEIARCIDEVGIGFLFAPRLHPAMKYAAAPRQEMLTNPASASVQLMGVYDPQLTETLAQVLRLLGVTRALVVHGADGLDELSTTGDNKVTQLSDGEITTYHLDPRQLGLPLASLEQLKGGTAEENARITLGLLQGEKGPKRDIVLLNAAGALVAARKAPDFESGLGIAAQALDSGQALKKLEELIRFTQSLEA
jgi:anthranilate phosphoribosyltransferase